MFPKKKRLDQAEFKQVFNTGKRYQSPALTLIHSPLSGSEPLRVAVSVGKKINKQATERNRLRRRIYLALRQEIEKLSSLSPAGNLVFIAKPAVQNLTDTELKENIRLLIGSVSKKS